MLAKVTKLWSAGTQGKSSGLKRQILLSNQLAFFGVCATLPYQVFYAVYDFTLYGAVFAIGLVFAAIYLFIPAINGSGHHGVARNLVLTNATAQLVATNYFISTGSGVNLYFLTIASILSLIFYRYRARVLLGLGCLIAILFVTCELLFSPGSERTPVPAPVLEIMYIASAMGSIGLTGIFAYLFRAEIERFEVELRAANRNLEILSTTDELTGLINRRGMDVFLDKQWARMRRDNATLSMVMCDVDYFKAYNDHYGHPAGDDVLRRIAAVLQDAARRPSDMVARYGGEEFALILPYTDASEGRYVSGRILASIRELAIAHAESEIGSMITVSVGFSTMTADMDLTPRQVLQAADRALYIAKRSGRNRIAFEPLGVSERRTG